MSPDQPVEENRRKPIMSRTPNRVRDDGYVPSNKEDHIFAGAQYVVDKDGIAPGLNFLSFKVVEP